MAQVTKMTNSLSTREEWLTLVARQCEVLFCDQGYDIPKYKVTCGFPSKSAVSPTKTRLGECWAAEHSDGNIYELFISPLLDDPIRVTDILIHEMAHAVVGTKAGHGGAFKKVALAVGLTGKMASTEAGEALKAWITTLVEGVGPYPHHKLTPTHKEKKAQKGRMLKAECPDCRAEGSPYIVRMSAETMKRGVPLCPIHGVSMIGEQNEDDDEQEPSVDELYKIIKDGDATVEITVN